MGVPAPRLRQPISCSYRERTQGRGGCDKPRAPVQTGYKAMPSQTAGTDIGEASEARRQSGQLIEGVSCPTT